MLHTRSDGKLLNISLLKAKTKIRLFPRYLLFVYDTALVAHTEGTIQRLIDSFSHACDKFGLIISIKKTKLMGQAIETAHRISIGNGFLKDTDSVLYLGSVQPISSIKSNLDMPYPRLDQRTKFTNHQSSLQIAKHGLVRYSPMRFGPIDLDNRIDRLN